jgi:proteasome alpha subunit
MSMPFYVSPEQLMKDRADYARKGIGRGRPVVVLQYDEGVLFATENPSRALHKVSEIYDRIAFAAVGKYNEFENLRVAGVRYADLRGYSYDRVDVTARGLANAYAQTLGTVFTTESKPLEVELVVVEVGTEPATDQIYRLSYDGSVADEHGWVVMGGQAERLASLLGDGWHAGMTLREALALAVGVLGAATEDASSKPRNLEATGLEVGVLDRTRPRRAFRRLTGAALEGLMPGKGGAHAAAPVDERDDERAEDRADEPDEGGDVTPTP